MRIALLFVAVIVAGCATTQSLPVEDRGRIYDMSFDVMFDAIVMALSEEGFAVTDARKNEGIINTDFRTGSSFTAYFRGGPTRTKVNALVTSMEAGTQVLLNIALEDANIEGRNVYATRNMSTRSARRFYSELFARIEAAAWPGASAE